MKLNEFDNSVFYRVACDCGDSDHDAYLEISCDDFPCMSLHFTSTYGCSIYWGSLNWFERQWKRFKESLRMLFLGYVEVEYEFIFLDEDHVDSFVNAILEGKSKIEKQLSEGN